VVDSVGERFGVRSIGWSASDGFVLNNRSIKLRGGCVHHDNGPLGSATVARAEARRVELLKANGYNAIRTSHNPVSPSAPRQPPHHARYSPLATRHPPLTSPPATGEPRVSRRVRPIGCAGDGRGLRLLVARQERRRLPHLLRPMVAPRPGGDGAARPQPPVGGDLVDWERDPHPQHPARLQPIGAARLLRPRARPPEAAGDVGVPGRRRQGRSLLRAPRYRGVQLLAAAVRVRPQAPPRPRDGRDRIVPRRVVHVLVQRVEPLVRRR
jgi:hypothetical protein